MPTPVLLRLWMLGHLPRLPNAEERAHELLLVSPLPLAAPLFVRSEGLCLSGPAKSSHLWSIRTFEEREVRREQNSAHHSLFSPSGYDTLS